MNRVLLMLVNISLAGTLFAPLQAAAAAPPCTVSIPRFVFFEDIANYKVDPFIKAACELQSLGKENGIRVLRAAATDETRNDAVIILCRMLFTAKPKSTFREPALGQPLYLQMPDREGLWPLLPIEIVDGVPFFIANGYSLSGVAEPADMYLDYCVKECDWSTVKFSPRTDAQKNTALIKLLASPKFKHPLDEVPKAVLSNQIDTALVPKLFFFSDGRTYRADTYINSACRLQSLGKEKAIGALRAAAKDELCNDSVIVLCRMLFTAKPKGTFRRPMLGKPELITGTDARSWPLEPIEIVDGVPLLITGGYTLGGEPEPADMYLDYCIKECEWSRKKFTPRTAAQKEKALQKLLTSHKLGQPLVVEEVNFLSAQLR